MTNIVVVDHKPAAVRSERIRRSLLDTIVGRQGLRAVLEQIQAVAPTDVTVLVTGETGTGKEVIARAIHELSSRRSRNLVKVNCAAMPAGLLESELFGHERGAFTGAINSHVGRFALADRGTLLLDEIEDIPFDLQQKLLRVLQEREFEPVGSTRTTRVDVRVVVASNRNLKQMVLNRKIRELQNYVARGVILSTDGVFDPAPPERYEPARVVMASATLEDTVRQQILAACQRANWKLGGP